MKFIKIDNDKIAKSAKLGFKIGLGCAIAVVIGLPILVIVGTIIIIL